MDLPLSTLLRAAQLQFLTTSTYRRNPLFACDRFRWYFVEVFREPRPGTGFPLIGWVLMSEHFHLLIRPEPPEQTSAFIQEHGTAHSRGVCGFPAATILVLGWVNWRYNAWYQGTTSAVPERSAKERRL